MTAKSWHIEEGKPYPMGATLTSKGANFTLFSINAEKVELCLFDGDVETRLTLPDRVGSVFYGFVPGVRAGQRYGFRVYGRENAARGSCFNPQKLLIDPYSKKSTASPFTATRKNWLGFITRTSATMRISPKSIVAGKSRFNWGNDRHPNTPWGRTVLYEAHVKGLTKQFPHLKHKGTYQALSDPRLVGLSEETGHHRCRIAAHPPASGRISSATARPEQLLGLQHLFPFRGRAVVCRQSRQRGRRAEKSRAHAAQSPVSK